MHKDRAGTGPAGIARARALPIIQPPPGEVMPRLLVLANLEFSFDVPDGSLDGAELLQREERRLLRLLRRFAAEGQGSLERLEFEGFAYATRIEGADPAGYHYAAHDERAETA